MRGALIDSQNKVVNLIELSEDSDYDPGDGLRVVIFDVNDVVKLGDIWNGGVWVPNPETPPVIPVEPEKSVEERLNEMQTVIDMLVSNLLEG